MDDVLGLAPDQALLQLAQRGIKARVTRVLPPRGASQEYTQQRVLGVRREDGEVVLLCSDFWPLENTAACQE